VLPAPCALGYALGIIVEGAFIGRLMTITVGDFGPRIGTALALGAVDIFMRATFSRKTYIVDWLKPKLLTCAPCQERPEDKVDPSVLRDLRAAYAPLLLVTQSL